MVKKIHRILLAEDDSDFGNVLKQYIEFENFEVSLAPNGREALIALKNNAFDLCVLDVMMPEMDGFTLAAEIKKLPQEIPFIFLTAKKMKEDRMKGLMLGADDYICKPFEADELVLRIKNILRRTKKLQDEIIYIAGLKLDLKNLILSGQNIEHKLTLKEAELLRLLAETWMYSSAG